jgi:type I restriction enzyme S subunit
MNESLHPRYSLVADSGAWKTVPLGEIAEVKLGKMLDKAKHQRGRKFPYLRNINVRWGAVDTNDVFEMHFEDDQVERFSLRAGDVLVCEGGEPGRAAVWNGHVAEMKFQKAIHRVRFNVPFEARLLVYLLESLAKSGGLERRFTGSTIKHFTREAFIQLPIPLPPLPEQRRIVAEIEKQFTRLEAGVAALRRVQANLKRYRAAVLKAACEGRLVPTEAELSRTQPSTKNSQPSYETGAELLARILTERRQNWQGRGKYKEPAAPDTANLPSLPEGWTWATLDQLLIYLRNGWGLKPNAETGTPILRISSNRPMSVNLDDVRFLSGPAEDYAEYFVTEGDLLFTRYNGNANLTGVCGIVPALDTKIVHPDKLIRVRLVPKLCLPKFVGMVANVGVSRAFVASRARTTAGQTGISGPDLRGIPVMLPPLAEQTRIVAEVERRLSVVEELESVVSANLQRATRLRQSILQKAFTGGLV